MRKEKAIKTAIALICLLALINGAAHAQKAPKDKFETIGFRCAKPA